MKFQFTVEKTSGHGFIYKRIGITHILFHKRLRTNFQVNNSVMLIQCTIHGCIQWVCYLINNKVIVLTWKYPYNWLGKKILT